MGTEFKKLPWKWLACWIILPNLVIMTMWPIGGPAMTMELLLTGFVALNLKFVKPTWLRYVGIVGIYVYILAVYTAKSFNMPLYHLSGVHEYLLELNVSQSPEYLIAGVVVAVSFVGALLIGPRLQWPNTPRAQLSILAVLLTIALTDFFVTASVRGSYKEAAPQGTPIDSAMLQNAVTPNTVGSKNLVVVMVESWGVPNNAFDQAIDAEIWDLDRWNSRYEVTSGSSAYYGSTTNAELREWCGSWSDHVEFDYDGLADDCLPKQFAEEGFRTVALHSFNGEFFHRWQWYPRIGFDEQYFDADIIQNGAGFCDGLFGGACDRDVPKQITKILKTSASERNLVYWLTVNAHLPVSRDHRLGTSECGLGDEQWRSDFPMLCRSYAVHQQVADALHAQIMADDFPEADVLIVGDHMPPFFSRSIRSRFDSESVPWIYLRSRQKAALDVDASAASATNLVNASALEETGRDI